MSLVKKINGSPRRLPKSFSTLIAKAESYFNALTRALNRDLYLDAVFS